MHLQVRRRDGQDHVDLHYVDDIIAATTDRVLREIFFDHIRKKWVITTEESDATIRTRGYKDI